VARYLDCLVAEEHHVTKRWSPSSSLDDVDDVDHVDDVDDELKMMTMMPMICQRTSDARLK
jgi:hypothetical protein